ncbi:uncharacterized protein LOC124950882 [Vespa velutina]|uniref:uncharacterized protein LOC124950882 n=1 Tax=Vespa velutina TaxID=202808 RepID=UPI001FB2FD71|nr:uncharacterized protein LOC124950882 [Vespa velutina]XP_047354270.1 uncharacterized protein LOC124950882 [Vespa velutina]XP_047354271.1 uncharacterized protein LOC124950882 [Vespa velutina]
MNVFRIVSYVSHRAYSRKNVGIRSKLKILEAARSEVNLEELDFHDLDEFEAEFMNADKFHKNYEREVIKNRIKLKNQIVATKYFKKDKDPNFLTSVEKDQILKLHQSNPEEWTVEMLSKSFPALPNTIKKILKSNWSYKSVERILQYDATVINNWKLFKTGKLSVSPVLREHLAKFKDRNIVLPNRHLLAEKLIPPKSELPKPKSTFFTNIVQSYLDQNRSDQCNNKILQNNTEAITDTNLLNNTVNNNIISKNMLDKGNPMKQKILHKDNIALIGYNSVSSKKKITFDEFAKKELKKIYAKCPEEGITLLNAYKNQFKKLDNTFSDINDDIVQSEHIKTLKEKEVEEKKELIFSTSIQEEKLTSLKKSEPPQLVPTDKKDSKLDTYVKAWNKKIKEHEVYSRPIQIPQNIYQKGKTYRISDCYYDDDGEFLYRVPGVRN